MSTNDRGKLLLVKSKLAIAYSRLDKQASRYVMDSRDIVFQIEACDDMWLCVLSKHGLVYISRGQVGL